MTTKQKALFELIKKAYTTTKKGDKDIYILDTDHVTDMATQNAIQDIQRKLGVSFELSYEIMAAACDSIAGVQPEDFAEVDMWEVAQEPASVYTWDRLQYLDINNQADISELVRTHAVDIATACAVWYNDKVVEACEALRTYIMSQ